jgi:hypothetical protein
VFTLEVVFSPLKIRVKKKNPYNNIKVDLFYTTSVEQWSGKAHPMLAPFNFGKDSTIAWKTLALIDSAFK